MKRFEYASGIQSEITIAKEILSLFLKAKRSISHCSETCDYCQNPHLNKVRSSVKNNQPVELVLPAFPGKSPNTNKVLGHLPDLAEEKSLKFLNSICEKVKKIYSPGARIIICSDGRVFSDVVGMKESHVTEYQDEIDSMIAKLNLKNLSTYNMDELASNKTFDQVRSELVLNYGREIERIRTEVKSGLNNKRFSELHRMYCGLVKFLVEDALSPEMTKSKSQIQKESRKKAYLMIQRSNAWTRLIAEKFPHAVRLSIHPQDCGSEKLGIQLLGTETWMTPWHGVAVKIDHEFVLMKRWQAQELGAVLIHNKKGRPSHFEVRV